MTYSESVLRPEGRTKPHQPSEALRPHQGNTRGDVLFRLPQEPNNHHAAKRSCHIRLRARHPDTERDARRLDCVALRHK